eukprot:CAMPEP_0114307558 /NCGR_PEP_ID=MMETSP0059-20121206/17534_1 /TAXON_ID=36894 /ORGANISM="Pyramimonas parkeae, Strain CCMP726" /LENGTH=367 /DNA_ID=CAMNT_0001431031 /DNA_START=349 /DNA_END=1449 /DNA_ORIENTATION=-
MGTLEYRQLESKLKLETHSNIDSTISRAPTYTFRKREINDVANPHVPGPGAYETAARDNHHQPFLGAKSFSTLPTFASTSCASRTSFLSKYKPAAGVSHGSSCSIRPAPLVVSGTAKSCGAVPDGRAVRMARVSRSALRVGRYQPSSPCAAFAPNPYVTPNTARSVTVNDDASRSPFALGANATLCRDERIQGLHAGSGTGSTWLMRSRSSNFTRGNADTARETTLEVTGGGRSVMDRHLDEHPLGPGEYGQPLSPTQALFGPGWIKSGRHVVACAQPGIFKAPTIKFDPVSRSKPKRGMNANDEPVGCTPGPGRYYPRSPVDRRKHDKQTYSFGRRLPSMFNPSSHVDPLQTHPRKTMLTSTTVPW